MCEQFPLVTYFLHKHLNHVIHKCSTSHFGALYYCGIRCKSKLDLLNVDMGSSCWRRGLDLPCGSLVAGARKHNSTIDVLSFEVPAAASQEVQPSSPSCPPWFFPDPSSNDTCRCGESIYGAVKCNETLQESAILDCYCVTYNKSTGVVAGPCFYNCENIPKGQEDTLYHPLPHRVEDLNSAMCGQFHRGGQLVDPVRRGMFQFLKWLIIDYLYNHPFLDDFSSLSLYRMRTNSNFG